MTFEEARPQQTSDPQVCLSVCLSSQHFHAETSSTFLQCHILLLFFLAMPRDIRKAPDEQPPAMRTCSTSPPPLPWLLTVGVNTENRKPRPYSTIWGCYTSNQYAGEDPWLEELCSELGAARRTNRGCAGSAGRAGVPKRDKLCHLHLAFLTCQAAGLLSTEAVRGQLVWEK